MRKLKPLLVLIFTVFVLHGGGAQAQDVTAALTTVWEMFWQQAGFPRAVYKWQAPIRVKFTGASPERHKEFALSQLRDTAAHAGISVTEVAADDATANLHVEFFGGNAPLPDNQPCVTFINASKFVVTTAKIQANEKDVWRCMLHESMHLMGVPGHPMRYSVLTYFARELKLSEVDKLMLKTVYSDQVAPGTSPFALLEIIAQRLIGNATEDKKDPAKHAADTFLRKTIQEMEAFGNGTGEAPNVIVRSGKATAQGIKRGQIDIQYFLGVAYLHGHLIAPDKEKAQSWFAQAAASGHGGAVAQLKRAAAAEKN